MERNGEEMVEVVGKEEGEEIPNGLHHRLEQLYRQVDAVKMLNLKRFLDLGRSGEMEGEAQKLSQMILKAIEVELRILSLARNLGRSGEMNGLLNEIWEAILSLPGASSILNQESAKEELLKLLEKRQKRE